MSPRDIQRSVRANRFNRSAGDAPNLGKISRIHGTAPLNEAELRHEHGGGPRKKRRNVILTWTAVLVVVVLGVLAVFFWSWLKPRMGGQPTVTALEKIRNVSAFASPSEEAALKMVNEALAVRDPAMVERYFRPGSAEPAAIIAFLTEMEARDGALSGCQWLSSMDANGLLIDGVLVNTSKDGVPRNRLALLTPDEAGAWKIDFDAFARTVKPSWDELLATGGGKGLVRVIVAKDSYYNGPFKDETQWVSYGMASPDTEVILLGYCRKDSPQARAMERIVSRAESNGSRMLNRATLELQRPETAENRQFEITHVLAEDWVVGTKPLDALSE